jgi:hypothetical protein
VKLDKCSFAKKPLKKHTRKSLKTYLHRYETQWMHLQVQSVVYKIDVELDQIMTYFFVPLSNICAYFWQGISSNGAFKLFYIDAICIAVERRDRRNT